VSTAEPLDPAEGEYRAADRAECQESTAIRGYT
jgi:hypothetical protein